MSAESKSAGKFPWPPLQELVRDIIADINANPVDLLAVVAGTAEGERRYLEILGPH